MPLYSLLVLLVGVILCRAVYIPHPGWQRNPRGDVCVQVVDHPCNEAFNKSAAARFAKFPNSRGLMLDAARKELDQYISLIPEQPIGCYREMWSLLCFHYFPQCHPNLSVRFVATPCQELCVRAQAGCEDFMRSKNITWPDHLECANFNSSTTDHMCVNSPAPSQTPFSQTPTFPSPTTTSALMRATNMPSTPSPTPSPVLCETMCRVQSEANSSTFRTSNYTFAANVTIVAVNCDLSGTHTYLAIVTRSWILDQQNCSRHENRRQMIIRTTPTACLPPCPNLNTTMGHNIYLVSGYCNEGGWYLPTTDSLVSPWFRYHKYQTKLDTWMRSGSLLEE